MEMILELEIPASPEYIAIARLVVSSIVSSRRNLPDDRIDDLKLAVSEACTNAIEAYGPNLAEDGAGERVRILVQDDDEKLEVDVADSGPGFDPDDLPTHPPVTDPERLNFERGLGIPLIRTLVDDVQFVSSPGGTSVRMTVYGEPLELHPPEEFEPEGFGPGDFGPEGTDVEGSG
ncbi:MAG: serine/threonine-protein kinase RsbW [Acidimicrobiaceae bacterium]|jgi:serine/threonine-protein kinase RsbW|nr:serine/threonine-protein kinase RsbW [Acidimicrobiaceae bacterium]MDQ1365380.1 serine/threonine-protein kinase RsbW [Acidimicrobiaceae bacterium]MDQ1367795.1 serine/threonine-protein kinase RsbW [Acidimicrobiaceae bacterium]MDQ1377066.1 serine/threonine-protein kinase RsbW [Acidimicrobiaceae bacterium]MDQ1398760.1 serine/threonine-protein kinase RsbW [Acidimicrobiaceae bacterium]